MSDLKLTHQLLEEGLSSVEIERMFGAGDLHRIRRGAYAATRESDPAAEHRRLIEASIVQGHPGSVVSHVSAAVLHGLPVRWNLLGRVHVTRARVGGGQQRRWVQVHGSRLTQPDHTVVDALPVTTPARTVVDLACTLPPRDAVAAGDAALRAGVRELDLEAALDRAGPRHGIAKARRTLALLDPRSESYGESASRVVLHEHDIVASELQLVVLDPRGTFLARCDFGWPDLGVLGEFDGRVKYGRTLAPDGDPEQVLFAEKRREDAVRDLGWQLVRWTSADVDAPAAWLARLDRAFDRGRTGPAPVGSVRITTPADARSLSARSRAQ